jgi:hypothetical protein
MAEQKKRFGFRDPSVGSFDDDAGRERPRPYAFGRSAATDRGAADSVPLFLSEEPSETDDQRYADQHAADDRYAEESYQDEPYQDERYQHEPFQDETYEAESFTRGFRNPLRTYRRATVSFRILMAVLAATCGAMLFALFSSDATRNFVESAKASITSSAAVPTAAAETESSTQLSAQDMQLKDPTRLSGPVSASADSGRDYPKAAAVAPSRDDIASAYQSALQGRTPAAEPQPLITPQFVTPQAAAPAAPPQQLAALPPTAPPMTAPAAIAPPPAFAPAAVAPAPVRRIDPEELSMLMKRAKDLLASGDIPPARLLLERAAGAQEPSAALLLAQTYDPQVLGTRDVRNINADLATARKWYQKAAQLGSADAQRRLGQMQN